ncbi:LacI family DNA-binding transcriptional regulator [Sphingomonas cannabina]|uniref:LacI family DNA-binding transcriptional regulator n=1 Tax=Sphingomonas cannabina TaxID=2899123 RepID=UPI001F2971DE|nr:LacI family DNA-binding transcriptional regulator [Sphingomonas cannabina]UIJ47196.1 LacI family DNA-binding transcriptional regulator [Sphingomonas cannabina]
MTIHDVARHAGVSSMTVSRVINGARYVSKDMREKVEAAIRALNYSPNLTARSLKRDVRIGALYSNPSSSNLAAFLMGAFRQSGTSGCQFLIEPGVTEEEALDGLERLIEAGIGGVILPPPLCDSALVLERVEQAGVLPLAFATAKPREGIAAIVVDDYKGAFDMTRHLIAAGHRAIGFIQGDPRHSPSQRREQGYRAALAGAGITIKPEWIAPGLFTYKSGLDAARLLLAASPRPTAIFASNDDMAAAVSAVAQGMGLTVPRDLSIAGFDDAPIASTIWPELTTIRQPIADMAATAVAMLSDQVREVRAGTSPSPRHVREMLTLVERDSIGPAPERSA